MTRYDDAALLPALARAGGLKHWREGELVWRVQSSRFPRIFYRVKLDSEGGECNCAATAHCRHMALAMVREFPYLLTDWRIDAEARRFFEKCREFREERHRAECRAWRESVAASVREAEKETERLREQFRRRQVWWEEYRVRYSRMEAVTA